VQGDDRVGGKEDRVAVGRGSRHFVRADSAGGTGTILDQELLAERLRQPVRHQTCSDVRRAAGRERHDEADRLRRPGLRLRGRSECENRNKKDSCHGITRGSLTPNLPFR
jgi:hypothetical protein